MPPPPSTQLPSGPKTVVLAGDGAGPAAREFAEAGGFPLLAEPTSGARSGPNAVGPYRLLLGRPDLGGRVERAVVFGRPTLSRPVSALLARRDIEVIVVAPGGDWPDAARNAAQVVMAVDVADGHFDADWLAAWHAADQVARQAIDKVLDADADTDTARPGGLPGLTGPLVAREVWAAVRAGQVLVVGSSNPIRDLDLAAAPMVKYDDAAASLASGSGEPRAVSLRTRSGTPVPHDAPLVVANRGLAGIDGTLSTAAGVALAAGRFTRVLLGDLAFLHDVGGLLVGPLEQAPELQVVVVNDDGGGIFSLLEQGQPEYADVFERVFGTPHHAGIGQLCAAYGLAHVVVDDLATLRRVLAEPEAGRSVVEVRIDRGALRDLHDRLRADVNAALS